MILITDIRNIDAAIQFVILCFGHRIKGTGGVLTLSSRVGLVL